MKPLVTLLAVFLASLATLTAAEPTHPNILFITADDMNFDSTDVYGGPIKDLTPHLDALAGEGIRFHYAYSTVAVCQPVRETMHTGLYPHRSGAMGFFPIKPNVRTLNQQLHDAGYLISMIGKNPHYQPTASFCVDYAETQISREPTKLAACTKKFIAMARAQGKPFFHHVNCTDPHRPFIGTDGPNDLAHGEAPTRWIKPEEVSGVPGFLEDLPPIRKEVAQYYTSVRRLDDSVGAVLQALKEVGADKDTIVMFYGGDHGMSFPFAKSNDYENSSRGALMFRWPGTIKPGVVDRDHLVSTLDFTPTLLEAVGLPPIPDIDGRSFLPALKGEKMSGWDRVFTVYNATSASTWVPMRCIRTKDRSYIWNAWSDGKMEYKAENMAGLTWKAMLAASATNPAIKARTDFYVYRTPEEFYDMTDDRFERRNLIADPAHQSEIESLRKELLAMMQRTGDPFAEAFARRDQPTLAANVIEKLNEEYVRTGKARKTAAKAADGEAPKAAKAPKGPKVAKSKELIAFGEPEAIVATEPVTLIIQHHFPDSANEQSLTVSMLTGGPKKERLDRKVVKAKGEGEIEVTFAVPAEQSGKSVKFAAFVGEDFNKTPQYIQSDEFPVK